MNLQAVIFDLDGVITDTAEFHYRAWQQLADEERLPFNRKTNERLRGSSRRDSLLAILDGKYETENRIQELIARKDSYYVAMLNKITPEHLLPGVLKLLDELDTAHIPYAIAATSKNTPTVCERLGITDRLAVLADGHNVDRQKPYPDLFRYAAAKLNCPPGQCLVVEDAAAGIEVALAAGMSALALGPAGRFETPALINRRFARRDSLEGVTLAELLATTAPLDTWLVSETTFQPERQQQMETVFSCGNGYISSRGSFEEGFPGDLSGTFANGVYDDVPIVVTELANLPNWLDLSIRVDGHLFRLDKGQVRHYRRQLDLRRAVLSREVRWQEPNGATLDFTFERFISYSREHLGAIRLLVTAVNRECQLTIEAGIDGHVDNEGLLHWRHLDQGQAENGAVWLRSRTRHSGIKLGVAAKMATSADGPAHSLHCPGQPRIVVRQVLSPGQTLQVDKLISYATGRDDARDAGPVVERALDQLAGLTYDELQAEHSAAWSDLWLDADVVIEGDEEAQLAIRFSLYQLLVAAPQRDGRVSIPAKTLSGFGYRGHVFWDTEIFALPFFTYVFPHLARNMLLYRHHTLPGARRKAAANGYSGAQFAWESAATGDEVTPTWVPEWGGKGLERIWTGDIQIHISADIAYAVHKYWQVTGDDAFMLDYGAEIILDTARFWGERVELEEENGKKRYALRDVIGPDEYHIHVDNNAFTNRLVKWHLETALRLRHWLHKHNPQKASTLAEQLDLTPKRLARWQEIVDHLIILHDLDTGLIHQFEGFFDRIPVDPETITNTDESIQEALGIDRANDSQILKQADVIMLLCLLSDIYDAKTWQVNWDTYMPITDHRYGSSLGPSIHAWAACEMDRPEEAYEHFILAAQADLKDIRGNAGDGIHGASAGGLWQAIAFGFAGLRLTENSYTLTPRLPAHWRRLAFKFYQRGQLQVVDIRTQSP